MASLAEYYREHGKAFRLALELKITPAEAAERLRHQAAIEHCHAAERRLQAKINAPLMAQLRSGHDPEEPRPAWWQRED